MSEQISASRAPDSSSAAVSDADNRSAAQEAVNQLEFFRSSRVPVIRQSQNTECGLACLAMVTKYYGRGESLRDLRAMFGLGDRGMTLADIMRAADKLALNSRPLRIEPEDLAQLKTPSILHWQMNHYVVLKRVKASGIEINDPASGERFVRWADVDNNFTGVALELTRATNFEKTPDSKPLRISQLWSSLDGLTRSIILLVLLSFVLQGFSLISPLYMQSVVDKVLNGQDQSLLVALTVGFLMMSVIQIGIGAIRSLIVMSLSSQFSLQMVSNLLRHLLRLPLSFFEKRQIGDITSRFGSLEAIKSQISTGVVETVIDGLLMVTTLIMMLSYSVQLSALVIGGLTIYLISRLLTYPRMRELTEAQIHASAKKESNFLETIRSMQWVKLFGGETKREVLWQNSFVDAANTGIKLGKMNLWISSFNQLLFSAQSIALFYLGASLIMGDELTVGMLFAFTAYSGQFTQKANSLVDIVMSFRMLRLHLDRVGEIVLEEKERHLESNCPLTPAQRGELKLEDVTFRYSSDEEAILDRLSLHVPDGQTLAIVGPSGCGKTTLLKVMAGLLEPQSGVIRFNDQDIKSIGGRAYRSRLGVVMQDDLLLSGSLSDNIAGFGETVDMERVQDCARQACIHEDIIRMPMGYNTLMGEMGNSLSGGQKARVLLARALYRQPGLLILDEATANLDIHTEKLVNENLKNLRCTRIIAAHRPDTIRMADRILRVEQGKLIEVSKDEYAASGIPGLSSTTETRSV